MGETGPGCHSNGRRTNRVLRHAEKSSLHGSSINGSGILLVNFLLFEEASVHDTSNMGLCMTHQFVHDFIKSI